MFKSTHNLYEKSIKKMDTGSLVC